MPKHYFGADDLFSSRIKTYPQYEFYIVPVGSPSEKRYIFLNKHTNVSGSRNSGNLNNNKGVPNGYVSLYEMAVDRRFTNEDTYRPFVVYGPERNTFKQHYKHPMVSEYFHPLLPISRGYTEPSETDEVYFKTNGGYPLSASLTRKLEAPTTISWVTNDNSSTRSETKINVTASALNNLAKKYTTLSKHFVFKPTGSSPTDFETTKDTYWGFLYPERTNAGAASGDDFFLSRNMLDHTINYIFIPSIFYGSTIKKGSVKLNFYITGSLMAQAADIGENGELIQLSSSLTTSGSTVGIVLYDEGIIMLTASHNLETGPALNVKYDGSSALSSSWLYYGAGLNDTVTYEHTAQTASFGLEFKGTSHVNTMTMFCHAKKGELNYSNNPTFKKIADYQVPNHSLDMETQHSFKEREYGIKNIASSSYVGTSEKFEKTTYISKVAIYDDDGNLIAVAHTAKPIKKTEERDLTFKLKLDI